MARIVGQDALETLTARQSFPWDEWTDGNIWELTAGADFANQTPAEFRSRLYAVAKRRGLIVRTKVTESTILFRFEPDPEADPEAELV